MNPYEPPAYVEELTRSNFFQRLIRSKELDLFNLSLNLWNWYAFGDTWLGTAAYFVALWSAIRLPFSQWFRNVD